MFIDLNCFTLSVGFQVKICTLSQLLIVQGNYIENWFCFFVFGDKRGHKLYFYKYYFHTVEVSRCETLIRLCIKFESQLNPILQSLVGIRVRIDY